MDCLNCRSQIADINLLFFFCKGEKDVHLSIKPEFEAIAKKQLITLPGGKKKKILTCCCCNFNVGGVLPLGPGGTDILLFALGKVILCGTQLNVKRKWWNCYSEFSSIQRRDINNFFNYLPVNVDTERKVKTQEYEKIMFPTLSNLSDFEWYSVSLAKQPRPYQIKAFIEVLQRNLIAVIKTGAGKTLIASMFLGRMCSLNPNLMGLLIVDRVPLVFQQGDAIQSDTNLRVFRICGENRTAYSIKAIIDGTYDVLVVTAGSFFEMAKRKEIDIRLFCAVVFDECHHATGNHKYMDVLKLFTKQTLSEQPRILGLSASLFNAKTVIQAEKRLEHYVQNFSNAKVYCPKLIKSNQSVQRKVVTLTVYQTDFIHKVVFILNQLLSEICMLAGVPITDMQMRIDLLNSNKILGYLRGLEMEHYSIPNFNHKVKMCYIAIDSLDFCSALSVEVGRELLKEYPIFADIVERFNCSSLSDRLKKLQNLLKDVCLNSKVLIFVSSRKVARALFEILDQQFPHFNMQKVIGHAGFDGMTWEGDQEVVLAEFRNGNCNLLICTSVLEEGLDVASCDLVICYTGVTTLIQYIQSRGRARKAGSQFIIFESEEDYSRINHIQSSEGMLEAVLNVKQQFDACLTDTSKDIMMNVEQGMMMGEGKRQPLLLDEHLNSQEFSFNLYIVVPDGIDVNALKLEIIEKLEVYQYFKVNRFEEVITDAELELFSPEVTITYLVGAIPRIGSNVNAYTQFCQVFDFEIKINGAKLNIWTRNLNIYDELDKPTSVKCCGYKVGYLKDKTTASIGSILREGSIEVRFIPGMYIEIRVDDGIVRIPFESIGKFCLTVISADKFTLALPLMCPPFIYHSDTLNEDQIGERVSIESNGHLADELQSFANNPVLFIVFDICKLNDVKHIASSRTLFPVYLFDAKINVCETQLSSDLDVTCHSHIADIMYTMKCIKDCRMLSFPSNFHKFIIDFIANLGLDGSKDPVSVDTLELIQVTLNVLYDKIIRRGEYFLNVVSMFNTIYKEFANISTKYRNILLPPVPENYFLIKRIVVTPSRDIALPAVPVASNRLLRLLDSTEAYRKYDIIIVSFKDEHMGKARSCYDRIETVLKEGIWIRGIKYNFLLASGSQLREGKAFFISCSYQEILSLRHKIIPDLKNFKSVAKYLSRLGQYGTADKFVCKVSFDSIAWIDDIKAWNGDLTTDGAGKISMSLANQIATTEGIAVPSAFQVRYSGVKGILVTCLDSDPDFQGKVICFRQSQRKFCNDDEDLCIVGVSKFYDLTLNREAITLLSAIPCHWELEKTLVSYQENCLAKFCDIFIDNRAAQQLLSEFSPTLQSYNFNFIEEEYFFSLLQGIYRTKVQELKNKTNIPVAEGCILIGAPDPTGLLKENEVFVQLKKDGCEAEVKCCPALIYRNPCLHPGDQRRVNCVDVVELHHIYNVIVMPVKDCTISLASVCSGGDLDGDKFSIIWDPLLVPDDQFIYPPCNYTELGENTVKDDYCDMEDKNELSKFYCEVMKNDCLGRVATTHLAICDILPLGARDPVAVEMAKSQAQAVDFPKTGVLPQVPAEALKKVKEKGYPDFMQKAVSESYTSKKVLGDLYRRCKSGVYDFRFFRKSEPDIVMNMNLLVHGNEEYLSDAVKTYFSYAHCMEIVMVKFQLKVEADVVLGYATYGWSEFFQGDSGKISDAITGSFQSIVQRYRKIFFSDALDAESQKKKASAWYRVVNDPEIKKINVKSGRKIFLSFPWVVHDVLHDIISEGNHEQPSRINLQIGESAWNLFKEKSCNLEKHITEKVKVKKEISCAINQFVRESFCIKDGFLVELYGSTSIYVCEPESDVDIFVNATPELYERILGERDIVEEEKKIHFLRSVVSPALNRIVSKKTEYLDRNYPIIKCTITGDYDYPIQCDMSMNEVGIRKTLYIHHLYNIDACYLVLFCSLVRWARITCVVKSSLDSASLMDTADFYALIIHLLDCPYKDDLTVVNISRFTGLKYLLTKVNKFRYRQLHQLGEMLQTFFRKAACLNDNLEIVWPASGIPSIQLDKSKLVGVAAVARTSLHCLQSTRDANVLLSCFFNDKPRELQKMLSSSLSYAIGNAGAYHAARLTHLSGAKVGIERCGGNHNLLLKAVGSAIAIEKLRLEMRSLITTNKALIVGKLPNTKSRYFMEGCSIVIAQKNCSEESMLAFNESYGPYQLIHDASERKIPVLKEYVESNESWKDKEFERLLTHISQQLRSFTKENEALMKSIEVSAKFGCFNVMDLSSRLPPFKNKMSLRELTLFMTKGRKNRKDWKINEHQNVNPDKSLKMTAFKSGNGGDFARIAFKSGNGGDFARIAFKSGNGGGFARHVNSNIKAMSSRRGVSTTFTPGFLKFNTSDYNARKNISMIYHQALDECGFKKGRSGRLRFSSSWKVSMSPSACYEVMISLDADMKLNMVSERPLHWVHCTIISGKKQSFNDFLLINSDVRMAITSYDVIREGSHLYRKVLPEVDGNILLPIVIKDGKPILRRDSPAIEFVTCVRHLKKREMFTNGVLDASVVYGVSYCGEDLALETPFCDFSLHFSDEKMANCITNYLDDDMLREFVSDYFNTSLLFQETLQRLISSFESN